MGDWKPNYKLISTPGPQAPEWPYLLSRMENNSDSGPSDYSTLALLRGCQLQFHLDRLISQAGTEVGLEREAGRGCAAGGPAGPAWGGWPRLAHPFNS